MLLDNLHGNHLYWSSIKHNLLFILVSWSDVQPTCRRSRILSNLGHLPSLHWTACFCLLLILSSFSSTRPCRHSNQAGIFLFMALIMESLGKILISHSEEQKFIHSMFLKFITVYVFFLPHSLSHLNRL